MQRVVQPAAGDGTGSHSAAIVARRGIPGAARSLFLLQAGCGLLV